jgi:hypothetical protein
VAPTPQSPTTKLVLKNGDEQVSFPTLCWFRYQYCGWMLKAEHRLLHGCGTRACANIGAYIGQWTQHESRQQHDCEERVTPCELAGVPKSCDEQQWCLLVMVRNRSTINLSRASSEVLVDIAMCANLSAGVFMCLERQ